MIAAGFGIAFYLLCLWLVVFASLRYFVPIDDRRFATVLLVLVVPVHFAVLWIFNSSTPFIGSETDTFLYYNYSMRVFHTVGDYFDLQATRDALSGFEGTTFTHLLTIVNQFVGDSLMLRKILNIGSLWVMAFAWYRVARLAGGIRFARTVLLCVVLLPTLWYPFCVLYRDELTSALHSVFVASLLLVVYGKHTELISHIIAACGATLLLVLLRPGAIYINLAITIAVMAGSLLARNKSRVARYTVVVGICGMVLYFVVVRTNLLTALNIERKISFSGVARQVDVVNAPSTLTGRVTRGIPLFLMSEPTVVSNHLDVHDPEQYRGIMNGPWLVLGAPFAALGLIEMVQYIRRKRKLSIATQLRNRRARSPGAGVVAAEDVAAMGVPAGIIGYCLVWLVVSMYLWDFTRWRLPVVPALTLAAVWGYKRTSVAGRAVTMGVWLMVVVCYRLVLT